MKADDKLPDGRQRAAAFFFRIDNDLVDVSTSEAEPPSQMSFILSQGVEFYGAEIT